MGMYLNPGSGSFKEAIQSDIYVDKTEMINYVNSVIGTRQKYMCVSRPRRFGKTTQRICFVPTTIAQLTAVGCLIS